MSALFGERRRKALGADKGGGGGRRRQQRWWFVFCIRSALGFYLQYLVVSCRTNVLLERKRTDNKRVAWWQVGNENIKEEYTTNGGVGDGVYLHLELFCLAWGLARRASGMPAARSQVGKQYNVPRNLRNLGECCMEKEKTWTARGELTTHPSGEYSTSMK